MLYLFFSDETHEARGDKQSFTVACKISLRPKSLYLHCQMPKPTILDMQDKVENRGDEGTKTSIPRPLVV